MRIKQALEELKIRPSTAEKSEKLRKTLI